MSRSVYAHLLALIFVTSFVSNCSSIVEHNDENVKGNASYFYSHGLDQMTFTGPIVDSDYVSSNTGVNYSDVSQYNSIFWEKSYQNQCSHSVKIWGVIQDSGISFSFSTSNHETLQQSLEMMRSNSSAYIKFGSVYSDSTSYIGNRCSESYDGIYNSHYIMPNEISYSSTPNLDCEVLDFIDLNSYTATGVSRCISDPIKITDIQPRYDRFGWGIEKDLSQDYTSLENFTSLSYSPNGEYFLAKSLDRFFVFETSSWELLADIGHGEDFSFTPDSSILVISDQVIEQNVLKTNFRFYNTSTWIAHENYSIGGSYTEMAFTPNVEKMAIGGESLKIIDLTTMEVSKAFPSNFTDIEELDISPNGDILIVGMKEEHPSSEGEYYTTVNAWRLNGGFVKSILTHGGAEHSVHFQFIDQSPEGKVSLSYCIIGVR